MGGERLIRIRNGGEAAAKAVDHLLTQVEADHLTSNALVVIEGGDLKKTNTLRKRCEASPRAAAIGCYTESGRDIAETIRTLLADDDIQIDDDAVAFLAARLGEDRGITRAEIEKLILYAGPKSVRGGAPVRLTRADVAQSLVDSTTDSTFDIADAVLSGRPAALSDRLYRAQNAGVSTMAMAIILQKRLNRLLTARQKMADGMGPNAAMKAMRPPIFFAEQERFLDQLNRWPDRALAAAVRDLFEADLAAKRTGAPQREILERCFLRLATGAARRN